MTTDAALFDSLKYRVEVDEYGTRWHFNGMGQLHCVEGPAIEWAAGSKEWWQNGLRHRTDGPAVIWADGYKEWYQNGQRHCDGGPAIEWSSGNKEWWLNGVPYTEQKYLAKIKTLEQAP